MAVRPIASFFQGDVIVYYDDDDESIERVAVARGDYHVQVGPVASRRLTRDYALTRAERDQTKLTRTEIETEDGPSVALDLSIVVQVRR
jgi:hypothetical protein